MSNQQQPKVALAMAAMLALAGAGAAVFFVSAPGEPEPAVMVQQPVIATPPTPTPGAPRVELHDERFEDPSAPAGKSSKLPTKADRLARDLQREQIWTALGRKHNLKPAEPGSAAPSSSAASLLPTLDRNYVRESIREQLVPVAQDCYNTVLTQQDSEAGGKLIMKFTIIGDEEIGGVVEEATIDPESTLKNEFMQECLRESLMAVTFDAPPGGGRVEVTYPITFSPD